MAVESTMETIAAERERWRRTRVTRRRVRRTASVLVAGLVVVDVLAAISPPLRNRLRFLLGIAPVELPEAASVALVFAALALVLLGRGLRRGQRHAWVLTLVLMVTSAVLNVVNGIDVEEAVVALAVAVWLAWHHRHFAVRADRAELRRAVRVAIVTPVIAIAVCGVLVLAFGRQHPESVRRSLAALAERLGGSETLPLPAASGIVTPALVAVGIAMVAAIAWLVFSPRRHEPSAHAEDRERARDIVATHGGGTLDYFALRDDKAYLFSGRSLVAYAVRNGVCLVSPDPIGPEEERADVLADLLDMADRNGWTVAVIAAGSAWLPLYTALGMKAIYLGDEAVVDCSSFTLDGNQMKSLRGAYNRVTKHGYTVTFHDPATISPELQVELRDVMTETRRGEVERGFSMTLGRVFDPADVDLLLAVAHGPDGRVAAFCQYTPAPAIDGYSLDLMRRRADPDLPNGTIDVVVIETIFHLKALGRSGLALNFAVMREVVCGERTSPLGSLHRRVLLRFSDTMQIDSLRRYSEKFRPTWRPRFAVLESYEHLPVQGIAMADAESIWELPVIGRLLRPDAGTPRRRKAAAGSREPVGAGPARR